MTVGVSPTPPVVSVQNVTLSTNKKAHGDANRRDVQRSGQRHPGGQHQDLPPGLSGQEGSYTGKNAVVVKLHSANYSAATDSVTLTPRKPFALKARPLQLLIDGTSPSGLQDIVGRYLDGADNGQAGSNAVVSISKNGVSIE